jgi:hypothetical protein
VARSSGEAEFHAITLGCDESLHLKYIFEELGVSLGIEVLSDSSAGRAMCHRIGAGCLKHIQTKFFWVQECIQQGILKVGVVRGSDNPADVGTKAVTAATLRHLLPRCGLVLDSEVTVAAATSAASTSASLGVNPAVLSALLVLIQALQAKGDGDDDEKTHSASSWLALLFVVHVLGFWALVVVMIASHVRKKIRHDKNTQTMMKLNDTLAGGLVAEKKFFWTTQGDVVHVDAKCYHLKAATNLQSRRLCRTCG